MRGQNPRPAHAESRVFVTLSHTSGIVLVGALASRHAHAHR
jgi:hypothetical protein